MLVPTNSNKHIKETLLEIELPINKKRAVNRM